MPHESQSRTQTIRFVIHRADFYLCDIKIQIFLKICIQLIDFNSFLLHGVTVTYGNGSILFGIKIIGNTEWCTNLILTAVTLSDRSSVIKLTIVFLCQLGVYFSAPSFNFLDNGSTPILTGASAGWKWKTVLTSGFSSVPIFSSSYAAHKNARTTRSAPSDGSIT